MRARVLHLASVALLALAVAGYAAMLAVRFAVELKHF